MITILVGSDGSGKTSLAKELQLASGHRYIKKNKPETQEEKDNMLQDYLNDINGDDIIYDRCVWCEFVYGDIMRGGSLLTIGDIRKFEDKVMANGGGMIIHCTDTPERLWARCQERGEDYVTDFETLKKIKEHYDMILKHARLPVVKYTIQD